jgi:hypothetical protein
MLRAFFHGFARTIVLRAAPPSPLSGGSGSIAERRLFGSLSEASALRGDYRPPHVPEFDQQHAQAGQARLRADVGQCQHPPSDRFNPKTRFAMIQISIGRRVEDGLAHFRVLPACSNGSAPRRSDWA